MKKRAIPFLLSIVFLGLIFAVLKNNVNQEIPDLFHVVFQTPQGEERVNGWVDDKGNYTVFVPGYADLSSARLYMETAEKVVLDGQTLSNGMVCDIFAVNKPMALEYKVLGQRRTGELSFVTTGALPVLYIDTESGGMEEIHQDKEHKEAGELRMYSPAGSLTHEETLVSVKGRGNATWTLYDKKPYNLTLSEEADLIGAGAAAKWVLLANAGDDSRMRNKLVYEFAKEFGLAYSPESEWVSLYLNGCYAGVYQLCERNEVHDQRVDIPETGSFLVSMELENRLVEQGEPYVRTEAGQTLRIHYADPGLPMDDIWQQVENAILSEDGVDPDSGRHWSELIDLDSWARKYLVEEIFCNNDACSISQFFYYTEETQKIHAGPVWDYDNAMGPKGLWEMCRPRTFVANRLKVNMSRETPWFHALYKDELFYNTVTELYEKEALPLLEKLFSDTVSDYANTLENAVNADNLRWEKSDGDMREEVSRMETFMAERIDFLNSAWIDGVEYCVVTVDRRLGGFNFFYSIPKGEPLTELTDQGVVHQRRFLGWYYEDTNEPFDPTRPIREDTAVYAKWEHILSAQNNYVKAILPVAVFAAAFLIVVAVGIVRIKKRR